MFWVRYAICGLLGHRWDVGRNVGKYRKFVVQRCGRCEDCRVIPAETPLLESLV